MTLNRVAGPLAFGGALLVVLGSFSPWVAVTIFLGTIEVNGMDGDGKITIVCGLAAAALIAIHLFVRPHATKFAVLAAVALGISGVVGAADWANVNDYIDSVGGTDIDANVFARVGWGLQVITIGSFGGAVAAIAQAFASANR